MRHWTRYDIDLIIPILTSAKYSQVDITSCPMPHWYIEIYLVFTERSRSSFYLYLFWRFTVNQLTTLQAQSQWYKLRQRSICDGIPGSFYTHQDLQIKIYHSASKWETADIISDVINVWWCYATQIACIAYSLKQEVLKMQNRKFSTSLYYFGTKMFLMF